MPGTRQYQQSVRIPLNRIASDIRVKIFNQTPVLSTMKLSDTLPVLNCSIGAVGLNQLQNWAKETVTAFLSPNDPNPTAVFDKKKRCWMNGNQVLAVITTTRNEKI